MPNELSKEEKGLLWALIVLDKISIAKDWPQWIDKWDRKIMAALDEAHRRRKGGNGEV